MGERTAVAAEPHALAVYIYIYIYITRSKSSNVGNDVNMC